MQGLLSKQTSVLRSLKPRPTFLIHGVTSRYLDEVPRSQYAPPGLTTRLRSQAYEWAHNHAQESATSSRGRRYHPPGPARKRDRGESRCAQPLKIRTVFKVDAGRLYTYFSRIYVRKVPTAHPTSSTLVDSLSSTYLLTIASLCVGRASPSPIYKTVSERPNRFSSGAHILVVVEARCPQY